MRAAHAHICILRPDREFKSYTHETVDSNWVPASNMHRLRFSSTPWLGISKGFRLRFSKLNYLSYFSFHDVEALLNSNSFVLSLFLTLEPLGRKDACSAVPFENDDHVKIKTKWCKKLCKRSRENCRKRQRSVRKVRRLKMWNSILLGRSVPLAARGLSRRWKRVGPLERPSPPTRIRCRAEEL